MYILFLFKFLEKNAEILETISYLLSFKVDVICISKLTYLLSINNDWSNSESIYL